LVSLSPSRLRSSSQPTYQETATLPSVYTIDHQWFVQHPTTYRYQRPPLLNEWPDLRVPLDAVVTVHLINACCTVRVLACPGGPRLAEALATDLAAVVLPVRCALDVRLPRHVWG
jgi:hypothetical protein